MSGDQDTSGVVRSATLRLQEAGLENPQREAQWLVMHATGRSRLDLLIHPDRELTLEALARLETMVARRVGREPLQYVIGEAAFYGRTFRVTPDVLIPRPETEELVERILLLADNDLHRGVLDLGTGSGCIPVSLACERPGLRCVGLDISGKALEVARGNAEQWGAHVEWLEADMADAGLADRVSGPFSVLVSNPPYVPDAEMEGMQPEVRDHEPHIALFSGVDSLLFYRIIAQQSHRLVAGGGHVLVEIHADSGPAVCRVFEEAGLGNVVLETDLAGKDRMVHARKP